MNWIESVIAEAKRKGACTMADGVRDKAQLVALLFSAQGREFCSRHEFPSREMWNLVERYRLEDYHVYINSGRFGLNISQIRNIAIVGDSTATLHIDGPECCHNVIVGHGADVRIEATNCAVFEVVRIGRCRVETILDDTSVSL